MDLMNANIKALVAQEAALHLEINKVQKAIAAEKKAMVEALLAAGWKEYTFKSTYYGSHPEYGEGDQRGKFLFSPEVVIPAFGEGRHGSFSGGEAGCQFEKWLEGLNEALYVVIEEIATVN